MSGDVHVRFRERLGVRVPRATRLVLELMSRPPVIMFLGASVSQDVKCFFAGPAGHVRADLGDESQGGIGPDGVDFV